MKKIFTIVIVLGTLHSLSAKINRVAQNKWDRAGTVRISHYVPDSPFPRRRCKWEVSCDLSAGARTVSGDNSLNSYDFR